MRRPPSVALMRCGAAHRLKCLEPGGGCCCRGFRLQVTGYSHFSVFSTTRGQGGQVGQVRKVEKRLDSSGFGSSVPRWPSCFMGGVAAVAATEQGNLEQVSARFGRGRFTATSNPDTRFQIASRLRHPCCSTARKIFAERVMSRRAGTSYYSLSNSAGSRLQ